MRLRQREVRAPERRVAGELERLGRAPRRLLVVAEERGPLRLLGSYRAEVARVAAEVEQPLRRLEVRRRVLGQAVEDEDLAREQVRPREVERVLRRLEERDRAAEMAERHPSVALHRGGPRERPVEPDARVRVDDRARARRKVGEDLARLHEPPEVRQRVAQVRPEAHARARVVLILGGQLVEAALVELGRLLRPVEVEVRVAERDVDVRVRGRRDARRLDRPLEVLDGLLVSPRPRGGEAEPELGPDRRVDVSSLARLAQDVVEGLLGAGDGLAEPEPKLRVREPDLAVLLARRHRAGLEVLRRYAELPGEHPDRTKRRASLAAFDA